LGSYLFGMAETTPTMLADRALIRVAGPDVRGFLQGLLTQDVVTLDAAAPRWSGLLTPQGKVLFDFLLWQDGDGILIDCEATQAEGLARRLMLYRLRRPITIDPADGAVHWSLAVDVGVADPRLAALGNRWLGDRAEPVGGWTRHRLAYGVTEGVAELGSGEILWLECNAAELNGVSFAKGCYVGQENTARMHYRSRVNRRLIVVPEAEASEKVRHRYPEFGLAVDYRRVEEIAGSHLPGWLGQPSKPLSE
jgi:folate-binding protein YgfZ